VNRKKIFLALFIMVLLSVYFILLSNILAAPSVIRGVMLADSKILSDDGKTYKIINSENTFHLLEFVGKRVEVVGIIENLNREIEITLDSFKILSDFSDQGAVE
jgi:hypothetical protein